MVARIIAYVYIFDIFVYSIRDKANIASWHIMVHSDSFS